jgi:hypothetical protein
MDACNLHNAKSEELRNLLGIATSSIGHQISLIIDFSDQYILFLNVKIIFTIARFPTSSFPNPIHQEKRKGKDHGVNKPLNNDSTFAL